jgi:septal ring-binding cell division protein DamX
VKQAEIAKPVEPTTPPAQDTKPAEPKPVETPKPAEPAKAAPKPVEKTTSSSQEKSAEKTGKNAVQADNPAWVADLKDDAWVMQHGAFDSLTEARTFQGTALGYKAGQVFYTQRKGSKPYYILVTGPYAEKAQAEALMRQNPPLAKAWLRSAKSLKAQFQE